jgi:hypothetical protein
MADEKPVELTEGEIDAATELADYLWNYRSTNPTEMVRCNPSEADGFHQAAIELCQLVPRVAVALRAARARLAEAERDLKEHFALTDASLPHNLPASSVEDCPTWYDGCHCTMGTLRSTTEEYWKLSGIRERLAEADACLRHAVLATCRNHPGCISGKDPCGGCLFNRGLKAFLRGAK